MIRVVADTNVIASGLAGYANDESPSSRILLAWREGQLDLVTSAPLLAELARTLAKPYFARRLSRDQVNQALDLMRRRSRFVHDLEHVHGIATTPEDDLILATAVSGKATHLITGDRQLRNVSDYRGVLVLLPREFLDWLEAGKRV